MPRLQRRAARRVGCSHGHCVCCPRPIPAPPQVVSAAELAHTLELLAKLATRVSGGNAVLQLVEEARRISL